VVLPDHLHAIWTLPETDADFALRWRLIKSAFSHRLVEVEHVSPSRVGKGERGIWQRRYWEHTLRNEDDFARHADYIHFNPVKHGHVACVKDWPHRRFTKWCDLVSIRKIGRARAGTPVVASARDNGIARTLRSNL
jgi:putative transposase